MVSCVGVTEVLEGIAEVRELEALHGGICHFTGPPDAVIPAGDHEDRPICELDMDGCGVGGVIR
jgi:hypothetical protein